MTDITMKPVSSSRIAAIGFDEATGTLRVKYQDRTRKRDNAVVPGGVYECSGFAPEDHEALMGAESIGSHFHKHMGGKDWRRVDE